MKLTDMTLISFVGLALLSCDGAQDGASSPNEADVSVSDAVPEDIARIAESLQSPRRADRDAALSGATPGQRRSVARVLIARYDEPNSRRAAVLHALGRVGRSDDDVVALFAEAARSDDREVRRACAAGLEYLRPQRDEVVAILLSLTSDADSGVVLTAADSIRKCASPSDRLADAMLDAGERTGGGAGGLCFAAAARLVLDVARIAGRVRRANGEWILQAEFIVGLSERETLDPACLAVLRELATENDDHVSSRAYALLLRSPHQPDIDAAVAGLSAIVDNQQLRHMFEMRSATVHDVLLTVRQLANGTQGARSFASKFVLDPDERVRQRAEEIVGAAIEPHR